jgi:CheY-like chemotaxis protein
MDHYLPKPFAKDELAGAIQRVAARRSVG